MTKVGGEVPTHFRFVPSSIFNDTVEWDLRKWIN